MMLYQISKYDITIYNVKQHQIDAFILPSSQNFFYFSFLSSLYSLIVIHHLPLAADLCYYSFTLRHFASSRPEYDFLCLSMYLLTIIIFPCDCFSCFRAIRAGMWLAESVSINHHTLWSIFTFTCCTYMNQNICFKNQHLLLCVSYCVC